MLRLSCLGGEQPGFGSPLPGLGLCAPRRVGLRVLGVPAPGGGVGGGGPTRRSPRAGGRLASVLPSAFPRQATKRVSSASLWPWRAYRSGSCSLAVPGRGPLAPLCAGAGLLVHRGSCGSRQLGAWRRALLRPPSRTPRSCRGGGASPLPLVGWQPASPWPAGRWGVGGAVGGGGACAVVPHLPPPGGAACGPPSGPPSVAGGSPPCARIRLGSWGSPGRRVRPAAGGSVLRGGGGGGVAGGPSRAGGRSVSVRPPAFPGRATKRASLVALRSSGAWPPTLLEFVVACRSRVWGVCRPCAPARTRPSVAAPTGAGGGVLGGARRDGSAASPPGRRGPFGGGGDVASASGVVEGRRPRGPRAGGGSGGERGGGAVPWFSGPLSWGAGPWPRAQSPFFSGEPPLGIYIQPGLPGSPGRRSWPGRPSVGQPGGGGGAASAPYPRGLARGAWRGEGRGGLVAAVCSPAYPGRAPRRVASSAPMLHSWVSPFRCSRQGAPQALAQSCRQAAGTAGMNGRPIGGTWRAAALAAAVASPPLGAPAPSGGVRGRRLPGRPPAVRGPGGGWRERGGEEGGRGESAQSPPGPLALPPGGCGGAVWWFRSQGGPVAVRGGATLPPPPSTLWVPDPRAGLRSGPLLSSPGGGGGPASAGGGGPGQRSAVSGLRGTGPLPRARCPRPLPYWRWCAPLRRVVRWGRWGLRSPRAHRPVRRGAAVTCVVACVGAGAATAAGSPGGSPSG